MTHPLTEDWCRLARLGCTTSRVASWGHHEPPLAGLTIDEILNRGRNASTNLHASDSTVAALFRLAGQDPLARRTVLQIVLPRLIHLGRALGGHELVDVLADLAAITWQLAGESEGRWTTHLARRLVVLVGRRYDQTLNCREQLGLCDLAEAASNISDPSLQVDDNVAGQLDVSRLLGDAVNQRVIGLVAAQLLICVALGGMTTEDAARHAGLSLHAAKKARQRAACALRAQPSVLALCSP